MSVDVTYSEVRVLFFYHKEGNVHEEDALFSEAQIDEMDK